jgi:hypothetical protein
MKISIDDWHFVQAEDATVLLDVYFDNGQHGLLEVHPMKRTDITNGQTPEMIVFCEMPGEKLNDSTCVGRWIARPPSKNCPWSHVEVPPALLQIIREKLGYGQPAPAGELRVSMQ